MPYANRFVFLDVEGTLVDDWFHFCALPGNIRAIREFLSPMDTVCLFTYAVFDKYKELVGTSRHRTLALDIVGRPELLDADNVFAKRDAMAVQYEWLRNPEYSYSLQDELRFNDRYCKQDAFANLCLASGRFGRDAECVLVDDTNGERHHTDYPDRNLRISYETVGRPPKN